MTAVLDGPLGRPPWMAREIRRVSWSSRRLAAEATSVTPVAATASASEIGSARLILTVAGGLHASNEVAATLAMVGRGGGRLEYSGRLADFPDRGTVRGAQDAALADDSRDEVGRRHVE